MRRPVALRQLSRGAVGGGCGGLRAVLAEAAANPAEFTAATAGNAASVVPLQGRR
jgi:hypothetical protein